jgi:uncharacterized protein (DUF433 family)
MVMQDAAFDRITIDPRVCHGKPVIQGARVPVAIVTGSLADGMSFEEVATEFGISIDDIRAAIRFATHLVEEERHYVLPA